MNHKAIIFEASALTPFKLELHNFFDIFEHRLNISDNELMP